MGKYLHYIFSDHHGCIRTKIIGIYSLLIIYTLFVWLWAFYALKNSPLLFSTAILAFTFGLRHAVDVDHIAAIDNVTRKLLNEGKQPVAAGLFFSLGHSTVVIIATVCIALATATFMHAHLARWHTIGGIICTSISALFLILIAIINLLIFISTYKVFKQVKQGKQYEDEEIDKLLNEKGFLAKKFRHIFQVITHSWQMYPVGFLFGIGFDTATEIALLGLAASQAMHGLSIWSILIFPALFTAGMTLIDTTDSILMIGTYGWALVKPIRKLYYNLTITFISLIVALCIGSLEVLGLIANKIHAKGIIWSVIENINSNFNLLGYFIILIFIASWFISVILYKFLQVDEVKNNSVE